jgi:hypothetical protein
MTMPETTRLRGLAAALLSWALALCAAGLVAGRARGGQPDDEFGGPAPYDEVVLGLARQLSRSPTEAVDAAAKLAQIGRRAVPVLVELLRRAPNAQVKYYAALALSRARHPSAAQALLPLLSDEKAARELRLLAVEAVSSAWLAESIVPLKSLASAEQPDEELRQKALEALSVMPGAWSQCEELFVGCLDARSEATRSLGAQACLYAAAKKITYASGEPRLLELAQSDPSLGVRGRAVLALARMKSGRAVALFIRLLSDPATPSGLAKQILAACEQVTGVPLRDAAGASAWWEKFGKARYENAPPLAPRVPTDQKAELAAKSSEPPSEKSGAGAHAEPAAHPPQEAASKKEGPERKVIPDDGPPRDPYSGVPMGK